LEYLSKISACRNQQALLTLNTRTHTQKACVLSVIYFPSLSTSLQSYALAEADLFQAAVSSYNPQNPEGRVGLGMLCMYGYHSAEASLSFFFDLLSRLRTPVLTAPPITLSCKRVVRIEGHR
jgi:hypothetical protein